jgi:hypothetical protein
MHFIFALRFASGRRAADERDELATPHSITSSAAIGGTDL